MGDLLSRFSSDANIVAKSMTQNISDGLRALISGIVGLAMMGHVSMYLTVCPFILLLSLQKLKIRYRERFS